MTKYISPNPADQPLHDMMDEIEACYQKCEKNGIHPLKIYWCLQHMTKIYFDNHPELEELEEDPDLVELKALLIKMKANKNGSL